MRTWLGYVIVAVLWCLFVIAMIKLIQLATNTIYSRSNSFAQLITEAHGCCAVTRLLWGRKDFLEPTSSR